MDVGPTLAGFNLFLRNVVRINTDVLPVDSPWINAAYEVAYDIVDPSLAVVVSPSPSRVPFPSYYARAVYNLGTDRLVNFAPDEPPSTYFTELRKSMGVNNFTPGVVSSTNDESTGGSLLNPEVFKNLTISQLQNLSTPWGRAYLGMAQAQGNIWGLN